MATSTSTATATTTLNSPTANIGNDSSSAPTLQACKSSGCKIGSFVEKTKRKCSQFVSTPYIMPKPLVVNGTTAIFQMGGQMAKVGDIPALSGGSNGDGGKAIYRIKPGTHAHVINYVLVDEGSDSMEKAMSGDQETMRMLLDSQRESAVTKLQKFIANHRGAPSNATTASSISTNTTPASPSIVSQTVAPVQTSIAASSNANAHVTTPQIHPDFSIASVEGAVPFTSPMLGLGASTSTVSASGINKETDRLQAEILELRRTVALLQSGTQH